MVLLELKDKLEITIFTDDFTVLRPLFEGKKGFISY